MTQEKTVTARSREEWRSWLEKNHLQENSVSLIFFKKHTGKSSLNPRIAMDEAICFGWIDTTLKRVDEDRYMVRYVKRSSKSRWSNATQSKAKRLIKERKMSKFGLKMYKEGLLKPVIDLNLPKNPDTPEDFLIQLAKNKTAKQNFDALAPSYRRQFIYAIERAKRQETRKARIAKAIELLKKNQKMYI